jgi:lysozyme
MTLPTPPNGWSLGLDVSQLQGKIDVPSLVAAGVAFLYLRATDGIHDVDPQTKTTPSACIAAGLPFGCYGVLEPYGAVGVGAQATHFVSVASDLGATLPPWLDFELARGETGLVALQTAADWCDFVESATKVSPMVYCGPSFIETLEHYAGPSADLVCARLATRRLVVAHYTGDVARLPTVPSPWKDWTIWQASGGRTESRNYATLPGTTVDVDVDWVRGPVSTLRSVTP